MSRRRRTCAASSSTSTASSAPPSPSSSTTWAWSWTSPTAWSSSTTAARSPTARPTRSARTRRCSTPTSGSRMSEVLHGLVAPFADIASNPSFFVEVLIGGVAAGLMYSLVALGFVLIFKASGVFNFAQGVMVLFAALTLVGLIERGVPVVVGLVLTMLVMVALAFAIERVVLRPLVNQEYIILFMATIGLSYFLEGFGELLWGSNVKKLDVGIPDTSFMIRGVQINKLEMTAALTAAVLVTVLAVFFQKTRIGRALRAVADDHEAALSIGIPLKTIWIV